MVDVVISKLLDAAARLVAADRETSEVTDFLQPNRRRVKRGLFVLDILIFIAVCLFLFIVFLTFFAFITLFVITILFNLFNIFLVDRNRD